MQKGNLAQSHQKWRTEIHSMSPASLPFFLNRLGITFGASLFIFTSLHIFIFGPLDLDYPWARSVLKALWGVCLRIAAQMIYKLDKGQKLRQGLPSPSMAFHSFSTFCHPPGWLADTKMKSFDHKH